MADEPNAAAGRTPGFGSGSSASPAAASRIRVDISDVAKLKTAIKDTRTEATKLAEAIGTFDKNLAAVKRATTTVVALQQALAGSGVSGVRPGPSTSVATAGQGGHGAANMNAGGFSGSPGAGVGGGPSSSYLPRVNLMPQGTVGAPSGGFMSTVRGWFQPQQPGSGTGGGSYNQQGTFSGQPARNTWATTPAYRTAQSLLGGASAIATLGASHLNAATERSYMLNRYQLTTGGATSTAAQTALGASLAGRMGNTALNYADVTRATSTLQQTGVMGGAYGQSRFQSVGFLSTLNPLQGNQASAQQMAQTFTSQNYYAMRLAGINASIAKGQNIQQIFDQIIQRIEGQMGRKMTMTEIQSGAQQGTHLNADLTAMGLSPDMIQQMITYWAAKNRGGIAASGATNNLGRSGQIMGSAQANAVAQVDKGYIGGAEASERGAAHAYNVAGGLAGSTFGQWLTRATGGLSAFAGMLSKATKVLETLAVLRIGGALLSGGGAAGRGGLLGGLGTRAGGAAATVGEAGLVAAPFVAAAGAGLLINQGITDKSVAQHAYSDSGAGLIASLLQQARAWGLTSNPGWMAEWKSTVEPLVMKATSTGNSADQDRAANALRALNHKYHAAASYGISRAGGAAKASASGKTGGRSTKKSSNKATPAGMSKVAEAIHAAEQYLGTPYVYGGASPRTGFDCSGLMQFAYKQAGVNIPRTAAEQQAWAASIDPNQASAGDLLFYDEGASTAQHVMMYLGNGKAIEAPHTGDVIKIIAANPAQADGGVGRVVGGGGGAGLPIPGNDTGKGDSGDTANQAGMGATSAGFLGDLFQTSSAASLLGALSAMGAGGFASTASTPSSGSATGTKGGASNPSAPANISGAERLGKQMAAKRGWTGKQWDALYHLWMMESGWNANAVNKTSGAYGIPQALGHGHPYNLGDAAAQINWGLNYIKSRYGDPVHAWNFEMSHTPHWYEKGTWNIVKDELAQLHKGEMVLPAKVAAHVRQLVETPQAAQMQGAIRRGGRSVPVQLVFYVQHGTEHEARQHAARFAKYVAEDHDIEMVSSS